MDRSQPLDGGCRDGDRGAFSWSVQVPQQTRLVSLQPTLAPVVLGLNNTGTYLGVTTAGIIGAFGIPTVGAHNLGIVGAVLALFALAACEFATWRIGSVALRTVQKDTCTGPLPPAKAHW